MRPPADAGAFGPKEYRSDAAFTAPGRQGQRQEAPLPSAGGPGPGRRPAAARRAGSSCRALDNNPRGELDYPLNDQPGWAGRVHLPAQPGQQLRPHEGKPERTEWVLQEPAMRGRKPRGPEIVRALKGGDQERQRLEAILDTVAGRLGVTEAADGLQMTPQRLHMLREQALQAALDALAPQP